jgi:hypothetical protein
MSKVKEHYDKIIAAVQEALKDDVRVHVGGDPAVVQVTRGTESYCFSTMYVDGDYKTGLLVTVPRCSDKGTMAPLNTSPTQFTGSICKACFNATMIRTGTCETCVTCGDTSSCG